MPAWPLDQPVADQLGFVRGIIVHDQMHVEIDGHIGFDFIAELAEFGCAVPRITFSDHMTGGDIECGKQRGCAVALVILGAPRDLAGAHRKHRLAAVKRLYLRLFIDAQHDSVSWRCHIQANNVPYLVDKIGIGRELERAFPMGLEAKRPPDALHGRG